MCEFEYQRVAFPDRAAEDTTPVVSETLEIQSANKDSPQQTASSDQ
jgi:hypothetical protein